MALPGTIYLGTMLMGTVILGTALGEATSLLNIRPGTAILAIVLGRTSRLVADLEVTFLRGTTLLASLGNTLEVTTPLGIITMGTVIR